MNPRRRPVTITDVAKQAGVSITTVSFVLNDAPDQGIPEETRERVRAAARELGYRPNASAKQLRTNQSHTIGFITDNIATTPFAGNVVRGAQDAAWRHGKMLFMVNTDEQEHVRDAAIEMMLERRVEGLVYAAMFHREVSLPAAPAWGIPVVLADCFTADRSLPSVVPDEVAGGRSATSALLAKGHRRIGFVNLDPEIVAAKLRLVGYREALEAHGIAFDPGLVRHVGIQHPGRSYLCACELLDLPDRPTALFCGNDRAAMEAYDAIQERGLRVPDDIAVVGFDNMELIAAHLRPPLSTVALPHYEMGRWAVEHLCDQRKRGTQPEQHLMPCPYVERESI